MTIQFNSSDGKKNLGNRFGQSQIEINVYFKARKEFKLQDITRAPDA